VEVKLRDARDPEPLAAVRAAPRKRRLREAAQVYLRQLPKPRPPHRFDVVLVTPRPDHPRAPQIDCLVDVFDSEV
jgi:Holliday junction resolvase-like predicted endonuclease